MAAVVLTAVLGVAAPYQALQGRTVYRASDLAKVDLSTVWNAEQGAFGRRVALDLD